MIRVGIVGLGFMGRMHYRCWKAAEGATLTAVCEANPKVIAAAGESAGGNVEGAADRVDLTGLGVFTSLDEMLASGTIDAISITLPTHLHPDVTVKSLEAGLHVLCEKPMALDLTQCDRMIAAAKAAGRVLQIGHCIRFWPEYVVAHNLIRSGQYGKVVAASFRRFSATPTWSADNWFADEARSGGQPLDLHIHDSDYVHHVFGMPAAVASTADLRQTYISTQYRYPDGKAIVAESTWRMAPAFGFEMSFVIVLEKATIVYDCTRNPVFRVCPAEGPAFQPEVPAGDGYERQVAHFVKAARGEKVEPIVTPENSRETIRLVLAEKAAARQGTPVSLE